MPEGDDAESKRCNTKVTKKHQTPAENETIDIHEPGESRDPHFSDENDEQQTHAGAEQSAKDHIRAIPAYAEIPSIMTRLKKENTL